MSKCLLVTPLSLRCSALIFPPTYRLQCPVSLETVEDGDHRLSRPQDLKLVEDVVLKIFNPKKNEASRADSSSELDDDD